jgi:hypothetical protein
VDLLQKEGPLQSSGRGGDDSWRSTMRSTPVNSPQPKEARPEEQLSKNTHRGGGRGGDCDAPGFRLVLLMLMIESAESNRPTAVKPRST